MYKSLSFSVHTCSRFSRTIHCYYLTTRVQNYTMTANSTLEVAQPASPPSEQQNIYKPRYIDVSMSSGTKAKSQRLTSHAQIGINLTDPVYRGLYHSKQGHPSDFEAVLSRAQSIGCEKMIITGSDVENSEEAVELAKQYRMSSFSSINGSKTRPRRYTNTVPSRLSLCHYWRPPM